VFNPIVEYTDYEELDSVILVKEMKIGLDSYYSNFKSIDVYNKNERKKFQLKRNDIIFIEATFDLETKKNKILIFFKRIIKFVKLYLDIKLIKDLEEYKIKPIILYDNNYNIIENDIKKIKGSLDEFKEIKCGDEKIKKEITENI
jgi:hypothetical protein